MGFIVHSNVLKSTPVDLTPVLTVRLIGNIAAGKCGHGLRFLPCGQISVNFKNCWECRSPVLIGQPKIC